MVDQLTSWISEAITTVITDWVRSGIEFFVDLMQNVLLGTEGLAGIALTAYNLFVGIGALLLVTICLARIITMLLGEADNSKDGNVWKIILDTIRSGISLIIMPFIVSFSMNYIVIPLSQYFLENINEVTSENIDTFLEADGGQAFQSGFVQILLLIFVFIAFFFFCFKIFQSQANILLLEVLSPLVAISIASEEYDYSEPWWRDLLGHAMTIIVLTLTMVLFVEALLATQMEFWQQIGLIFGLGLLLFSGPTFLKQIYVHSGAGNAGKTIARGFMPRRFK